MSDKQWMTPAEVEMELGASWTKPRRLRIVERLTREGVTVETIGARRRTYLVDRAQFEAYLDDLRAGRRDAPGWWIELHPQPPQTGP